jgi:hypothetical protein
MLNVQLPRQAPTHANIAKVIDHFAENIPTFMHAKYYSKQVNAKLF